MNIYEKALIHLLEENQTPYFISKFGIQASQLKTSNINKLRPVIQDLEGTSSTDLKRITYSRDYIEVGDKAIIVDEPIHFNRYRNITLRARLYEGENFHWKVEDYKRYCRQLEPDALKSGLYGQLWTNKNAESVFGKSSEPGDFYGGGAAGWKLRALEDCLLDLYCQEKGIKLIRYAMQASIMIKGKLENYGKLLLYGNKDLKPLCFKLLARTVGLELHQESEKQGPSA